jgi:hypothetical protein
LSQCVHGRPPPAPPAKATPAPRQPAKPRARAGVAVKQTVAPRRTPQKEFRPFILGILQESGGRQETEKLFTELERRMEPVLRAADHEQVNQGEVRWRYAARLERKAMLDDGLMLPARPGVWELSAKGLETP